ncbi:MAG: hypothetical protein QOJ57_1349 [Thermoleophilaceae bacterium]|jgi:hypothetical protein|nr:hypothetical protein [Thermoleophilaceae bacterium]
MGEVEERTAKAVEELVHGNAFGEILARLTQNVMGVTKIGFDVLDLTVRNLRLAGRADITRLGSQLARTEDKLERVLQEVERLQSAVAADQRPAASKSSSNGGGSNSSGARAKPRRSSRSRAKSSSS